MTTTITIRDYDTAYRLDGDVSDDLVRESAAAGATGAVGAYLDGGTWQFCAEQDTALRRSQGHDVRIVYVEA